VVQGNSQLTDRRVVLYVINIDLIPVAIDMLYTGRLRDVALM